MGLKAMDYHIHLYIHYAMKNMKLNIEMHGIEGMMVMSQWVVDGWEGYGHGWTGATSMRHGD